MQTNTPEQDVKQRELLRLIIEDILKKRMQTPADFEMLRGKVYERTRVMISTSTLKRFWGYMQSQFSPSITTLDTLARFCGYSDFASFCQQPKCDDQLPSNPLLSNHIDVAEDLAPNDEVTLYWLPDRTCHLRYEGNLQFVVTDSENTHLHRGDTFKCNLIIEDVPVYLYDLVQEGRPPVNYSCGRHGGVRFNIKKHE